MKLKGPHNLRHANTTLTWHVIKYRLLHRDLYHYSLQSLYDWVAWFPPYSKQPGFRSLLIWRIDSSDWLLSWATTKKNTALQSHSKFWISEGVKVSCLIAKSCSSLSIEASISMTLRIQTHSSNKLISGVIPLALTWNLRDYYSRWVVWSDWNFWVRFSKEENHHWALFITSCK